MHKLINMYRVRGHLMAHLDPLARSRRALHPELDLAHYGLTIWDLDREFVTDGLAGGDAATLAKRSSTILRDAYCRTSASSTCTSRIPSRSGGSSTTSRASRHARPPRSSATSSSG